MSADLQWIRLKLYQWGRFNRARGIGFPSMSTTEKARIGRGGVYEGPRLPPDIEEIEVAVGRTPPQHKLIIIEHYTKTGTVEDHAARLRLPRTSYSRRREVAERHVGTLLQSVADVS